MASDFAGIIGQFIHHCGALELFTNNSIRYTVKDPSLSSKMIKFTWYNRIILLRLLLVDGFNLKQDDVKKLCDELDEIRKKRNQVAHNPILSTKPDGSGTEEILIIRYKNEKVDVIEKIKKEDIAKLVNQSKALLIKFANMVPSATST